MGIPMKASEFINNIYINNKKYSFIDINIIEQKGIARIKRLPFSIKILIENLLRKLDGHIVLEEDLINIARWEETHNKSIEIPYYPVRILMQDFTGIPALLDLVAMRDAVKNYGEDPEKVNPLVPVELVTDHSAQINFYGTSMSLQKNLTEEYKKNKERYTFLKWAQKNFQNLKIIPPNSGICHQINLEYLGRVVTIKENNEMTFLYPDTLIGTDSHTSMINSMGVIGWGVGGIEAEAVMLGQPYYMLIPEVFGVKMVRKLKEGVCRN